MSKFEQQDTILTNKEFLVSALTTLGLTPKVYEQARALHGYQGDERKELAHIVIPKEQVGMASNDIGFFLDPQTKRYSAIISDFDRRPGKYDSAWLGLLSQSYQEHKQIHEAKAKGYIFKGKETIQTAEGPMTRLQFTTWG